MSRTGMRGAGVVAIAALSIALTACGTTQGGGQEGPVDDVTSAHIEVLQPGVHPYVAATDVGIQAEVKAQGLTSVTTSQSNYDPTQEVAAINNAIAKGAKAIITAPNSSTGVVPALTQAIDAGICVVSMTNAPGETTSEQFPGLKAYIGWDEFENGQYMGRALAEGMGGSGNVVVINGVADNSIARDRVAGAEDVFSSEYPGITVLDSKPADWDSAKARSLMQDYIQRFGDDVDGVLVVSNNMGTAAADAIEESPLKGTVTIVSSGGQQQYIDYIKAGKVYATTPELPVTEGKIAVQQAVACLEGDTEQVFINEIDLPGMSDFADDGYVITKDNVDKFTPEW